MDRILSHLYHGHLLCPCLSHHLCPEAILCPYVRRARGLPSVDSVCLAERERRVGKEAVEEGRGLCVHAPQAEVAGAVRDGLGGCANGAATSGVARAVVRAEQGARAWEAWEGALG